MKNIRIATRGSQLALWQANYVKDLLEQKSISASIEVFKTTGDRIQDRYLHEVGGKGLFTKELEEALLSERADIAVHSLKDVPVARPEGLYLAAVLQRHRSTDTLIFKEDPGFPDGTVIQAAHLQSVDGLQVGTCSLRRQHLFESAQPTVDIKSLRGNVDSRLRKLADGEYKSIVLASASLDRLGIKVDYGYELDPDWFVPCPGQGALAVECRDQEEIKSLLSGFGHNQTRFQVETERLVLKHIGGDCTFPFGCHVRSVAGHNEQISAKAVLFGKGGDRSQVELLVRSQNLSSQELANQIVTELEKNNLKQIIQQLS